MGRIDLKLVLADGEALVRTGANPDGFDPATQPELDAHLADTVDAHDASAISFVPAAGIAATNVQAAIEEVVADIDAGDVDSVDGRTGTVTLTDLYAPLAEPIAAAHISDTADAHDASAISILDTANDFTATDVEGALAELQADAEADATALSDHLADTTDAHDASAISVVSTTLVGIGTDVQAVLEELDNSIADHVADTTDAHYASSIYVLDTANDFTATNVEDALAELQTADEADEAALAAHLADTTDAHDASAISNVAAGNIAATDVQAAINELDSEKVAKATVPVVIQIVVGDETTTITTGTAKVTTRSPFAFTLTGVRASLTTASSSGDPAVDINEAGVSVLSTTLTIDANEKTSTTAAVPAVISDSAIADDAELTIDIDTAGTGAAGLKVTLIGTRAV